MTQILTSRRHGLILQTTMQTRDIAAEREADKLITEAKEMPQQCLGFVLRLLIWSWAVYGVYRAVRG